MRKRLNDSEMSLFASVPGLYTSDMFDSAAKVTDKDGRGLGEAIFGGYSVVVRKCRYVVNTIVSPYIGGGFIRTFRAAFRSMGTSNIEGMSVTVSADSNRIGYGFMSLKLMMKDGSPIFIDISGPDARHMAQVLNAASNSCGATWRKSSIGS